MRNAGRPKPRQIEVGSIRGKINVVSCMARPKVPQNKIFLFHVVSGWEQISSCFVSEPVQVPVQSSERASLSGDLAESSVKLPNADVRSSASSVYKFAFQSYLKEVVVLDLKRKPKVPLQLVTGLMKMDKSEEDEDENDQNCFEDSN